MSDDIDKANYADLKTLEDRVRRTLFAHGFNEKTSTPLGDMNSLCRNLVQDAAATDAELVAQRQRAEKAEARVEELQQQLLMAASALDAGKDGCQFVRVMDERGRFICMAEVARSASQETVPLLEMSDRVGVVLRGGQS